MSDEAPPRENYTLLQGFEWNVPADGKHWVRLAGALPKLRDIGVTNVWLPPGCKASSAEGNGYDVYDLYDLGEFDQKGGKATKWGTKEELLDLCAKAKELGMGLYWDAVLNHKAAADKKEKCQVVEVDSNDRDKVISGAYEISAWLGFHFPGRGDKYSKQKYHWYHFSGTDYDAGNDRKAIFQIQGDNKHWSQSVDSEDGNADFLMFADLDYAHQEVADDVKRWGKWIVTELGLKGFRLDAVQHFSQRFTHEWVDELNAECGGGGGAGLFYVGEFWDGDGQKLADWISEMHEKFSLFDAPLLNNFASISKQEKGDLRKVFDGTLVSKMPVNAVNHDTQKGQTVETEVEGFFKPLAYALILLRDQGYPCIFYGDLYGTRGDQPEPPSCGGKLADIALARSLYAYGRQDDYWGDDANCVAFARLGTRQHPHGLVCVMSNAGPGQVRAFVGEMHRGERWTDVLGWEQGEVEIGEDGRADFPCPATSVAIWVNREAAGRDRFPVKFDSEIYK